ncbi:MAG: DUF4136 domain-containing protein [Bacteroidetes bacterium]|nr:DUF4136 domain-containing protein [Bacteroidota bacterium]MBS1540360.1 DUF4136 domain-containing protein [Bacteroidota bacterium]
MASFNISVLKRLLGLAYLIIFVAGCSIRVKTTYNHQTDFKKYKTFCWLEGCEFRMNAPRHFNDSLIKSLMQQAIIAEMKAKGIEYNSNTPDLLMDVHVSIKTDTAILWHRTDDQPFLMRPQFAQPEELIVNKGTLIIDLADKAKGQMVWRSVAVSFFEKNPELTEENFRKGVAAALKNFPPKK